MSPDDPQRGRKQVTREETLFCNTYNASFNDIEETRPDMFVYPVNFPLKQRLITMAAKRLCSSKYHFAIQSGKVILHK